MTSRHHSRPCHHPPLIMSNSTENAPTSALLPPPDLGSNDGMNARRPPREVQDMLQLQRLMQVRTPVFQLTQINRAYERFMAFSRTMEGAERAAALHVRQPWGGADPARARVRGGHGGHSERPAAVRGAAGGGPVPASPVPAPAVPAASVAMYSRMPEILGMSQMTCQRSQHPPPPPPLTGSPSRPRLAVPRLSTTACRQASAPNTEEQSGHERWACFGGCIPSTTMATLATPCKGDCQPRECGCIRVGFLAGSSMPQTIDTGS